MADDNPTPSEMVKRCAEAAIAQIRNDAILYGRPATTDEEAGWVEPPFDFEGSNPRFDGSLNIYNIARAVIAAIREPTTKMLKAGVSAYETPGKGFLIGAYNAMIDAALKE